MKYAIYILVWALIAGGAFAQSAVGDARKPELTISGLSPATTGILAYSPDGRRLAVANDNVIQIYDPRVTESLRPRLSHTLTGHSAPILGLAFGGTNTLVSISMDQTAKIWDIETGKCLHTAEIHLGKPSRFIIAPGHLSLAADVSSGHVRLWNYQTGKQLKDFVPNDSWANTLAFTPDGKQLAIGTEKGVLRVMDVASWTVVHSIDLDSPVKSLAVSAGKIVVGYSDGAVAVLNLGDQPSIHEVKKQEETINALAFSPKGDLFASASADHTVEVWDARTRKPLCSLQSHKAPVVAVVFSPDEQKIASMDANGVLNFWTVATK
jgi:WD40 repeat protein